METGMELRLAVLIDADNVPAFYIKGMLEEVARYGMPTIKRIYGDWTKPNLGSWKTVLLENAITPVQQYSYTTGKNATDSAMIIDAMDILYSGHVDGFCIVSSDSDFTRLAVRLRESGKKVIGMGEKKTPNPFIVACDKFIYMEVLSQPLKPMHLVKPMERAADRSRERAARPEPSAARGTNSRSDETGEKREKSVKQAAATAAGSAVTSAAPAASSSSTQAASSAATTASISALSTTASSSGGRHAKQPPVDHSTPVERGRLVAAAEPSATGANEPMAAEPAVTTASARGRTPDSREANDGRNRSRRGYFITVPSVAASAMDETDHSEDDLPVPGSGSRPASQKDDSTRMASGSASSKDHASADHADGREVIQELAHPGDEHQDHADSADEHLTDSQVSRQDARDANGGQEAQERRHRPVKASEADFADMQQLLVSTVENLADENGWAFLGDVGNLLIRKKTDFDPRLFGFAKLTPLIRSLEMFDLDVRDTNQPNVKHIYIRFRGAER